MTQFKYDPGERRRKHKRWKGQFFRIEGGRPVGQCPPWITDQSGRAEELLNSGAPWHNPDDPRPGPHEIYCVYEGRLYRAVATQPGRSYHGFPYRGEVPPELEDTLEDMAKKEGRLSEYRRWLKRYR